MTWFVRSPAERRLDELVSKMVEALNNRDSDPLLVQHLADCVRRQDKIEATLRHQDEVSSAMHRENSSRLKAIETSSRNLLVCVVMALLALVGTLTMQIVSSYKVTAPTVVTPGHR